MIPSGERYGIHELQHRKGPVMAANDSKVKGGTVVYLEGSRIGVNTSGEKVGGNGPDKDNLRADHVLDASAAKVFFRGPDGAARANSPGLAPGNNGLGHLTEIKNGDKISAGWVQTTHGAKVPTSITVTTQEGAPVQPVFNLPGPLGSEHGPQAVQTGVSQPHLNYVNTHQDVGPGGGPEERADPATPDGTPDASAKAPPPGTSPDEAKAPSDKGTVGEDLNEYTVPELKDMAAKENVALDSEDHKADIVRKIKKGRSTKK
jgi:hypothetical protein